jgi:hypothetical protein
MIPRANSLLRPSCLAFACIWIHLGVSTHPCPAQTTDKADGLKAPANPGRIDRYGDPLPPEALSRLGTVRFRSEDYFRSLENGTQGGLAVHQRPGTPAFHAAPVRAGDRGVY